MKFKKILILLLTILIIVSLLSGCKKEDTTQKIATPSQVETQSVEPSTEAQYGLLSSDAKVEIIDYNDKIKDEYVAPDNIGACVFSILTSNIIEEPIYENIGNGSELSTIIAKYSDIISAKNFNMTYNEGTQELVYSIGEMATTYSFGTEVEMFYVQSKMFDKNFSYIIDDVRYDKDSATLYLFLKQGWYYYEEANTKDEETVLKNAVKKAEQSAIIFFNELNEEIQPKKYVLIMPKK